MGLFDFFSKKAPAIVAKPLKQETPLLPPSTGKLIKQEFQVVGTNYYMDNIMKLAEQNPDWRKTAKQLQEAGLAGKRVFRYSFIHKPAKLIPEPDNPHDKNAVQAVVAGEVVGYIGRDENKKVLQILETREIKFISAFISGGPYKVVAESGETEKDEKGIFISMTIGYV